MLMGALSGAALAAGSVAVATWVLNGNYKYVFSSWPARLLIVAGAVAGFILTGPPR